MHHNVLSDTPRGEEAPARFELLRVSLLAAAIGIAAGLVAFGLYNLIALLTNLCFYQRFSFVFASARHNRLGLWVIPLTTAGGLIVGLMAKYGSLKIRGHGIPEAMEAVLVHRSRIAPKVALLKPLSAAIAIGSGGPFGAEGPIIQTGGAIGSVVGQLLHTTAVERKVLLACGAAAGMAATFSTPIAAVILAIELLLFEYSARSFIPLVIAASLATGVHFRLMGRGPMFDAGAMGFGLPGGLPFYVVLGILCGLFATVFSKALYWFEEQFEKLRFDPLWRPALGGVALGVLGFFVPRVLGVGYDTISDILNDRLTLTVLLTVLICKALAVLITIGSGTSGGLLAPLFMVSAALGASFAMGANALLPGAHLAPGAYALVAMAAVFGAAARAPFTFIIFGFEITRDYNAVLPLMLATVIAQGIALAFMRNSIMTEKLARRGLRVHQEYEPDVFHQVTVHEVMDTRVPTIPDSMLLSELAARLARRDPALMRHHALPIVNSEGGLMGIVTRGDVLRALEQDADGGETVLEAGSTTPVAAYPDESLHEAVTRMLRAGVGRLLVVDRKEPGRLIGYLGRPGIMEARLRRLEEEHVREPGWLARAQ